MNAGPAASGVEAVLLDIEGTTTPIAFVYDVLFPYVRTHLRGHLERHATFPEYRSLFDRLRHEHASDRSGAEAPLPWKDAPPGEHLASVAGYIEWLMDRDRKSTALKELQGRIWEEGYRRGELVGEVFPDVPPALERWTARHLRVAIFSSGSVLGQQLLFRHSAAGDLTKFLSGFFDTTIGAKSDSASFQRIAAALMVPPAAVVFASDVVRELDAARDAGMQTRLAVRPGNAPLQAGAHGHRPIQTFDDL